jgi:putative restriction endonuclease
LKTRGFVVLISSPIFIIPELVGLFKKNWSKLVVTNDYPNFALPFYHMNSEPFWKLIPTIGCEKWIESKSSMKSFTNLNTAEHSAVIDKELLVFLKEAESRDVLKISILDKYFPSSKTSYSPSTAPTGSS